MKIEVKLKMHGKINKPELNSQAFDVILKSWWEAARLEDRHFDKQQFRSGREMSFAREERCWHRNPAIKVFRRANWVCSRFRLGV